MSSPCGFTLLEVLIGLFILSCGLFGVFSASASLMQHTRGVLYYQQATIQAENMSHYLYGHQGDGVLYEGRWNEKIGEILPNGVGRVSRHMHRYQIKITWGKPNESCIDHVGVSGCVTLELAL